MRSWGRLTRPGDLSAGWPGQLVEAVRQFGGVDMPCGDRTYVAEAGEVGRAGWPRQEERGPGPRAPRCKSFCPSRHQPIEPLELSDGLNKLSRPPRGIGTSI